MLEGLFYGIAAAFTFIGIISTVYICLIHSFKTKGKGRYAVIFPSDISEEDIGALLYSAHMRFALFSDLCSGSIVVVDRGMDESKRTLCQNIMDECGNMLLCTEDEFFSAVTKGTFNGNSES